MPPRLTFGLVAGPSATDVLARFGELADLFRERGLVDLEPRPAESYKELADKVREGSTDVSWLGPVSYAWLAEGVTPIGCIGRGGETDYRAALVVRDDSKIKSLADLKDATGLKGGWVDPWSAAGYVVPRLELARRKILPTPTFASEKFYGSHRAALEALARGDCDIAATYARFAESATAGGWSEVKGLSVRVLVTWGPIPSDVIAVRRNLGSKEYEATRDAFRTASADETFRAKLRGVFGGDEIKDVGEGHVALRLLYESGVASGLFD